MNYKKLRIVTNGTKFRIQAAKEQLGTKLECKFNFFSFRPKIIKVIDKNKTEETWMFLDETGKEYDVYFCWVKIKEFNSKKEAINCIKEKWGQEGLDKTLEEWVPA